MKRIRLLLIFFLLFAPLVHAKLPYETNFWESGYDSMAVGTPTRIQIPFLAINIWEVVFVVQGVNPAVKNVASVYVNMTKTTLPKEYKPISDYYTAWLFNSTIGDLGSFGQINITYRVPYSWIEAQKLQPNQIALYLYNSTDSVQELPTIHLQDYSNDRGKFAKMQTSVPRFGLFVVAQKNKSLQDQPSASLVTQQNISLSTSQNLTNISLSNASSNTSIVNQTVCTEVWLCSDWSNCTSGTQTRQCTDKNNCSTTAQVPSKTQTCIVPATISSTLPTLSAPNATASLNKTSSFWNSTKTSVVKTFRKIPATITYGLLGVLVVLIAFFVLKPCLKKLFLVINYKRLDREFDKRVESLWKRRQQEENEEKKQKKQEEYANLSSSSSGRDLPGMPPRR